MISSVNWKDHWETMGKSNSNGRAELQYDLAICNDIRSKLDLHFSDSILNIGCGTGILEKTSSEYFIISIDFASSMLKREWIVNGVRASASFLPFRSSTFDKICVYSVIQYLRKNQLLKLLNEISRCLKKEGRCLIGDVEANVTGIKKFLRGSIGGTFLTNHFEYHSLEWISLQCKKLGMDSITLEQPPTLPFSTRRKDLLISKML